MNRKRIWFDVGGYQRPEDKFGNWYSIIDGSLQLVTEENYDRVEYPPTNDVCRWCKKKHTNMITVDKKIKPSYKFEGGSQW